MRSKRVTQPDSAIFRGFAGVSETIYISYSFRLANFLEKVIRVAICGWHVEFYIESDFRARQLRDRAIGVLLPQLRLGKFLSFSRADCPLGLAENMLSRPARQKC